MIKVNINQKSNYDVSDLADGLFNINGLDINPDVYQVSPTSYHIINKGVSYNVVVSSIEGNQITLKINGNQYQLDVKDKNALLLAEMGIELVSSDKVEDIKAPMPGLVLKLLVEVGDMVTKDTPLLILEAMKMENMIKSPGEGQVSNIKIKEKDAVEKGAILIEFK